MNSTTRASLFTAMRNAATGTSGGAQFKTSQRHLPAKNEVRKLRAPQKSWYRKAEENRGDWD